MDLLKTQVFTSPKSKLRVLDSVFFDLLCAFGASYLTLIDSSSCGLSTCFLGCLFGSSFGFYGCCCACSSSNFTRAS